MQKDKWNRKYSERVLSGPGEPSPILIEVVSVLQPGRALDLAAGQGRNAFYLAEQGWDTTAIDFSEVAVQKGSMLSRQFELPIRWEVQDLTTYKPMQNHYNLVCMFYLHMPWEKYEEILQHAAAAVEPGGTLIVVGHDRSNIKQGSGGPQDPAVLYTPGDITSAIQRLSGLSWTTETRVMGGDSTNHTPTSFDIILAETRKNPVDHGHSGRGGQQIDCVVVARRMNN